MHTDTVSIPPQHTVAVNRVQLIHTMPEACEITETSRERIKPEEDSTTENDK